MQRRSGTVTAPVELLPETDDGRAEPGLLAVFAGQRPACIAVAAGRVGRDSMLALGLEDAQMSREHFELELRAGTLCLRDLGSRNGTFVGGKQLDARSELRSGSVVRAGSTLFIAVPNLRPFERAPTRTDAGIVAGPATARLLSLARGIGKAADQLFITGESGSGKELVAAAFHGASDGRPGPFVAVNCATIQGGLAERLLFGARRGSFTGADSDAEGYVQAAAGGTLFLDEIAELEPAVQAKLLRFMETREFFALGDVRPRRVELKLCFATLKDLAREVEQGRFRADLRHRLATPAIALPPLRERKEEIPHLIAASLVGTRVTSGLSFVERALIAEWPGNVRQLRRGVEAAVMLAEIEGRSALVAGDLPDADAAEPSDATSDDTPLPSEEAIREALAAAGGNVSVAARELHITRSRLRRWMEKQQRPTQQQS